MGFHAKRFFTILTFCFGWAFLQTTSAYATERIHFYKYLPGELQLMAESERQNEQRAPRGSTVYSLDYFEIDDGPNSDSVLADTTFTRDAVGRLHATDMISGYTTVFSSHAVVVRKNGQSAEIVKPGEKPSAALLKLLQIGGAHYIKVLTLGSTEAAQPDCTPWEYQRPALDSRGITPECPAGKWVGGGIGTLNPPTTYLTAISNSCALTNKSLLASITLF